jgi:predicted permease
MNRFLAAMLVRSTGASLADAVAGDLEEERRRRARRSPAAARLWLWRTALGIAIHVAVRRVAQACRELGRGLGRGGASSDLRQALRSLRRTPWYSLTVIGVIALSMALSTTTFAVVDGVLFKPLPYPRSDELFLASGHATALSRRDVRESAAAVPEAQIAAYQGTYEMGAVGELRPTVVRAAGVGREFFDVLGVRPDIGGFQPADFEPNGVETRVLISHRMWVQQFGRAPDVLGQRLLVAGAVNHLAEPFARLVVAGVLGVDFVYPSNRTTPDVIVPIAVAPGDDADRNTSAASVILRLPPAVERAPVEARLTATASAQGLMKASDEFVPTKITLRPLSDVLVLYQRQNLRTIFIASAALIFLACVNVAGLTIARGRDRQRHVALRTALGATRWDLLRLVLAEVAPLLLAGTLLGLWLAPLLLQVVVQLIPASVALLAVPSVDARVIAFSAVACAMAIAIVGIAQRRVAAVDLTQAMGRGQSVTGPRGRVGAVVVAVQVAVSLVMVIGGAFLVSSLFRIWQQDPGVDVERVAFVEVDLTAVPPPDRGARLNDIRTLIERLPGVEAVGFVNWWFMHDHGGWPSPQIRRPAGASKGLEYWLPYSGTFFEVMGLRPIGGRLPTPAEVAARAPLLVVSERAARSLWPDRSALGQEIIGSRGGSMGTVIGVVPEAKYSGLDRPSPGFIYRPGSASWAQPAVMMRTRATPSETLGQAVTALRAAAPDVPVLRALTLEEAFGGVIRLRTLYAWLFGGFAVAALVIVGVGMLGLVAMSTARRTREIGIRYALGAHRTSIVRMLLREQVVAVGAGVLTGGVVAAWAVRFVKSYLYQFTIYDSRIWAAAIAILLATAALGTLIPARRASRTDPVQALRVE